MRILSYNGKWPKIAPGAFIAEDAVLIGDVTIGEHASVWYGCVLRADTGRIVIGAHSNVQDGVIMHCDRGFDTVIGERVTIGHGAIVHGAQVADEVLIGMRATLLNGAKVDTHVLIGAHALVTEGQHIPSHQVAMGAPCRTLRPIRPEQIEQIRWNAAHYDELMQAYRDAGLSADGQKEEAA